jgi:hypothetical protein
MPKIFFQTGSAMKNKFANVLNLLVMAMLLVACTENVTPTTSSNSTVVPPQLAMARIKIKHIYPGADGIPMQSGIPTICANDPVTGQCIKPFHDSSDINFGGPHGMAAAVTDINGGK